MSQMSGTNQQQAPSGGMSKTYVPKDAEPAVRAKWERSDAFVADPARVLSGKAKPFCILIPPPNVTGALHLGHALNNTLQDILMRYYRMQRDASGKAKYETLWMPGTDHAGIATQAVVEKRLLKEQGKRRKDFTREQFVELVQQWKNEYEARITEQLKAMGCSCDFSRQRFTMDEVCANAVREAFFILFRDGLIYRGKRLVNWDPALQTAVADDECYEEEVDAAFYYLRYPLVRMGDQPVTWGDLAKVNYPGAAERPADQQAWITVATTRPETYLGDTAVAMSEHDPRAGMLSGMFVRLPLVGRVIPIIVDTTGYVVLPKDYARTEEEVSDPKAQFATGFLKVTPAHDNNDYVLGETYKELIGAGGTRPVMINILSPDGKLSDKHGWTDVGEAAQFVGMQVMQVHESIAKPSEARKAVVDALKTQRTSADGEAVLEGIRKYTQTLKFSDRSKAVIEPYLSDQWFMRVTDERMSGWANRALVEGQRSSAHAEKVAAQKTSTDAKLTFHPSRYAKTFEQWHNNIKDWCISRQLWWGHRIPVWYLAPFDHAGEKPDDGVPDGSFSNRLETSVNSLRRFLECFGISNDIRVDGNEYATWLTVTSNSPHFDDLIRFSEQAAIGALDDEAVMYATVEKMPYRISDIEAAVSATKDVLGRFDSCRDSMFGWDRDPDVLDTWFSSALWPLSTLGWPDPAQSPQTKDLLQAFNPTSVLSTAREIITLWVSRMVMMNRYMLSGAVTEQRIDSVDASSAPFGSPGPVPFKDVFIHAVVQDGDGKRMSKSAGNGVDPLDIIDSHGADAMRFVLCQMTTSTQDVRMPVKLMCPHCASVFAAEDKLSLTTHEKGIVDQKCPKCSKAMCTSFGVNNNFVQVTEDKPEAANTSEKFDLGRNLCNKLWNASRFTMTIIERAEKLPAPTQNAQAVSSTLLIDRWILSRLATTVREIEQAIAGYEFSVYAEDVYKLLWWDFCDWYLEAIKPTVDRSPEQRAVLANVLDVILRVLHPVAPFITEAIHEHVRALGEPPKVAGITLYRARSEGLLATAGWPLLDDSLIDKDAEAQFESLRELVNTIRNVRSERQVLPKRRVTLHAPRVCIEAMNAAPGLVETLAGLEKVEPLSGPAPAGSVPFRAGGVELAISNLADAVDAGTESDRLKKQLEQLVKSEAALAGRLNNPGYADKAPAKLVEESKAQLAKIRDEIGAINSRLKELGA